MEKLKKWATSGIGITIAFIAFWPLGFVLLYWRFFLNGGKLRAQGNLYRGLAIFCYLCAACLLIIIPESTGDELASNLMGFAILFVGGIASTIPAYRNIKQYQYYKKYSDYLATRKNITVEELAEKMGKNTETIIEDVSKTFEYQMLEGYINEDNEIIIMRKIENNYTSNHIVPEKKQVLTLKCKNCGATNKFVVGKENRCEYCDSLLNNN